MRRWGGQLFINGKILSVKRRRGRPSKVPRPEEQMPTVPVPDTFKHFSKQLKALPLSIRSKQRLKRASTISVPGTYHVPGTGERCFTHGAELPQRTI